MKRISLWWLPFLLVLSACQQSPTSSAGLKLGKPYVIDGRTYYPEYDPTYDKIGEASWYGPGFHGKHTASGEIYNQNDMTAAHPTLPMPSLVRVTNLSNGKSLIVRVNDRGPFKSNRIIDLSKKSAQKLGVTSLAQVRVQFLKEETEEHLAGLPTKGGKKIDMASLNAKTNVKRDASIIESTEPSEQIVEATVSKTRAGQTVSDAAPIMSVKSGDLESSDTTADNKDAENLKEEKILSSYSPSVGKVVTYEDKKKGKGLEVKLIRDAAADTVVPLKGTNTEADSAPSKSTKMAAAALSPSASGTFYVQAGSFAAEENAHKLSSKLEGIGIIAVGKVEMGEKTWWRVRLGPFENHNDAATALEKVHAVGIQDARVVHL